MTTESTFQFPLRSLFLATTIVGLNAAAWVSRDWFILAINLIATSLLVSLELVRFFRYSSHSAAKVGFACCELHCALSGVLDPILWFSILQGHVIFGLMANPIEAGIFAAIMGLPLAVIVYLLSLHFGIAIELSRKNNSRKLR